MRSEGHDVVLGWWADRWLVDLALSQAFSCKKNSP